MARACALVIAVWALLGVAAGAAGAVDPFHRADDAVCKPVSGLAFCDMVTYDAALPPASDPADIDAAAQSYHAKLNKLLGSFDCKYKYSAHSCDACRDAYRYWVCGMAFPECGPNDAATFCTPGVACDPATSAKRLCLSLCEDVVRKCPYTLAFTCPTETTVDYDGEIRKCNKLDRIEWPPGSGEAWPGTFSAAPPAAFSITFTAAVLCVVAALVVA